MKQRDYFFDNAKFILIFFVVFGHLIQSFIHENEIVYTLYKVIYTFHMPAFILVSGFFARGFYQKGYIKKIAKKLILPYLIFQLIYSIFYYFLYNESSIAIDPLNPHWSLWFLISLFFWHIMLFGFSRLKPAVGLSLALAIGLGVGYFDWISNYLSLSRTFVFFPMFLLGFYLTKENVQMLTRPPFRIIAVIPFVASFIFYSSFPDISYQWLFGSKSYSALETTETIGMMIRLGLYILSTIMVFSFLAIVPKSKFFFTSLGRNTLYVYLLHGFFIRIFRESEVPHYLSYTENIVLLAALSFLLTLLLSSKLATAVAQPFIELKVTLLTKYKKRSSSFSRLTKKRRLEN
ncbi:acyltransferase family protein [Mesobacillus maritimus]|uniref:acyltransferase family protein n=1 Tax=Mesobacillus maritimus TaxID=1643336 RepID=UPI00203E1F3E|nr:acyltransferase family protein [Mesobacillus maritimus]MCM3667556.1 acyltransferase family protein [Mesobacillus maritimus]